MSQKLSLDQDRVEQIDKRALLASFPSLNSFRLKFTYVYIDSIVNSLSASWGVTEATLRWWTTFVAADSVRLPLCRSYLRFWRSTSFAHFRASFNLDVCDRAFAATRVAIVVYRALCALLLHARMCERCFFSFLGSF